ncbi:diguanylate cyclase [Paraburkholderia sp. RP-4-7]|uniref:Diguanylate cyclase n=1 Tax=Paraburkholderia polaris TaxID=2728848 RepID=A0A848IWH4_9BURK|nr:diguanylate cyclase [Paraburkholderia polaris]NMM04509.1 diguanylate cyclase [Paraburkholderia polaris]
MQEISFISRYMGVFREFSRTFENVCMLLPSLMIVAAVGTWFEIRIAVYGIAAAVISAIFVALTYFVARAFEGHTKRTRFAPLQQLAEALLSTSEDTLVLLDLDGRLIMESAVSNGLIRQREFTSQSSGSDWLEVWTGDDAIASRNAFGGALAGRQMCFAGYRPSAAGIPKWWASAFYPLRDKDNKVKAVFCRSRDVTNKTLALRQADEAATLLSDIDIYMPLVFWSTSTDFSKIFHVSSGFERMWQIPVATLYSNVTVWQSRVSSEGLNELKCAMRKMARDNIPTETEFPLLLDGGVVRWVRVNSSPVGMPGSSKRVISVCADITEERARMAELHRLANVDVLTGMSNRHTLTEYLASRCEETLPFSLLVADVDRFKVLNDTAGTVLADRLLRGIAAAMADVLWPGTFMARQGGDEFAIVIPGDHSQIDCAEIFEKLRGSVAHSQLLGDAPMEITLSAGIARFPEHGRTPEALMSSADIAMYAAKKSGRDTFRLFGINESALLTGFEMERDLRHAMTRGEFELYYQPLFRTATEEMVSVEALIRWNRPGRAMVPPSIFIPMLEDTGLIREVGQWVFDKGVSQIEKWRESCGRLVPISVNVSAKQLHDPTLPARFAEVAALYGVLSSEITLEITESVLVEPADSCRAVLDELKRLGFRIALDDFGTGFSSLSCLTNLQPDTLKLDKSLVDRIDENASAKTLVVGVIALARALHMAVVAEGVERRTQLAVLAAAGCEVVQGYLLGRPEKASDFFRNFLLAPPFPFPEIDTIVSLNFQETNAVDVRISPVVNLRSGTALKIADRDADMNLEILKQAVLDSRDGITISDNSNADQPLIFVNPAFERLTGYTSEEIINRNCRFLQNGDRDQTELQSVQQAIRDGEYCLATLRNYRKDGSMFWNELSISPIYDIAGSVTHFIGIQKDVTARVLIQQQLRDKNQSLEEMRSHLERLSVTDSLTGIYNRRFFDSQLDVQSRISRRNGQALTLMMVDVDHFKLFNDIYGHPAGDVALQRIATSLDQSFLRASDFIARYGGEEFVLLSTGMTHEQATYWAGMLCERVESLQIPHAASSSGYLTISIGFAVQVIAADEDAGALVSAADQALYTAKQNGRNRSCSFVT